MRISDWSSDVCSSDLRGAIAVGHHQALRRRNQRLREAFRHGEVELVAVLQVLRPLLVAAEIIDARLDLDEGDAAFGVEAQQVGAPAREIGRASCWERGCPYV